MAEESVPEHEDTAPTTEELSIESSDALAQEALDPSAGVPGTTEEAAKTSGEAADESLQLEESPQAAAEAPGAAPEAVAPEVVESDAVPPEAASDAIASEAVTPAHEAVPEATTEPTPAPEAVPEATTEPTPAPEAAPETITEAVPAPEAAPEATTEPPAPETAPEAEAAPAPEASPEATEEATPAPEAAPEAEAAPAPETAPEATDDATPAALEATEAAPAPETAPEAVEPAAQAEAPVEPAPENKSWQQKLEEAQADAKQEAALSITAALRARRFRKLLNNQDLINNDPGLKTLRHAIVRRVAASGHLNMESAIDGVCQWYRKMFHNEEGVQLSLRNRRQREISAREFTYGEVVFNEFVELLRRAEPRNGEKFVDLGSGMGKAVFAAHLFFPFSMSLGIELLDDLFAQSSKFLDQFDGQVRAILDEQKRSQRICFEHKNFLHGNWKDADIVFFSCSAFSDATISAVSKKCSQLKPGARIIMIARVLDDPKGDTFEEVDRVSLLMTFGPTTAYIFRRTDPLKLEKEREKRRALAAEDAFGFDVKIVPK